MTKTPPAMIVTLSPASTNYIVALLKLAWKRSAYLPIGAGGRR
jgi:hypothetical protein